MTFGWLSLADQCVVTGQQRIGPSTVSTVVLVLHALPLLLSLLLWLPLWVLVLSSPGMPRRRRLVAGLGLGAGGSAAGFALYVLYYRRCRPFAGWVLFLLLGVAAPVAAYRMVAVEAARERERLAGHS